jgi:hypothetical protein
MPGHVELRHHANATFGGIGNDLARLILRIEEPVRTHLMQLGKFLAFNPEALVFGEVPVKHIELDRGHRIQIPLEHLYRLVVTRDINQKTAPGKAWLILDLYLRQIEAISICADKLQKSLESP